MRVYSSTYICIAILLDLARQLAAAGDHVASCSKRLRFQVTAIRVDDVAVVHYQNQPLVIDEDGAAAAMAKFYSTRAMAK